MGQNSTNYAAYAQAALPAHVRVLGRVLQPFTLAHAILLERTGNPLWCGGQVNRSQLISAVWICSHHHPHAPVFGHLPPLGLRGRLWLIRVWLACFLDPLILISRATLLRDYITRALNQAPETYTPDIPGAPGVPQETSPEVVPWPITMLLRLVALGFNHADALNIPISLANWLLICDAANRGVVRIVSDRERDIFALHRSGSPESVSMGV